MAFCPWLNASSVTPPRVYVRQVVKSPLPEDRCPTAGRNRIADRDRLQGDRVRRGSTRFARHPHAIRTPFPPSPSNRIVDCTSPSQSQSWRLHCATLPISQSSPLAIHQSPLNFPTRNTTSSLCWKSRASMMTSTVGRLGSIASSSTEMSCCSPWRV
jgi:hypothetical protein